jgi:hypothetical protein
MIRILKAGVDLPMPFKPPGLGGGQLLDWISAKVLENMNLFFHPFKGILGAVI